MVLKIILLAAVAMAAWLLTRPRGRAQPPAAGKETAMEQCQHCGVYHPAGESCKCAETDKEK